MKPPNAAATAKNTTAQRMGRSSPAKAMSAISAPAASLNGALLSQPSPGRYTATA